MDYNALLLLFAIFVPLAAGLVVVLIRLPRKAVSVIAGIGFVVPALIAIRLTVAFDPSQAGTFQFTSINDTGLQWLGIHLFLGLNGISLPLFLLAGIVGLAAGIYALSIEVERRRAFLFLLLTMLAGLMGTFSSVDIFFFYFFHELALIPTFILIGIWGGAGRRPAAMKMTIYLTLGALLTLAGLIALGAKLPGAAGLGTERLEDGFC
ncbi:MAG: proton-conducting transporter membrane subunit, partial [Verrucomicrobiota bacterium]